MPTVKRIALASATNAVDWAWHHAGLGRNVAGLRTSDVYSLGVLLYELLTGSPPSSKAELENKGLVEVLRVVREDDLRPSPNSPGDAAPVRIAATRARPVGSAGSG